MIEVHGLTKAYGEKVAAQDLSFSVRRGEIFGLLGPNGAGKTTTIRILACIIPPDSGRIVVNGHEVVEDPLSVKASVGLLPERISLYERLTVMENLLFFARLYEVEEPVLKIKELLNKLEIQDRAEEPVSKLSKGLKQRVSIVRALLHDPPVLLLDEPTSGLDPMSAGVMRSLIQDLSSQGRTILLSSHNLWEVQQLCHRVAMINTRLLALGSVDELSTKFMGPPRVRLLLDEARKEVLEAIQSVYGVITLERRDGEILIEVMDPERTVPAISEAVVRAGGRILEISVVRPELEELFARVVRDEVGQDSSSG